MPVQPAKSISNSAQKPDDPASGVVNEPLAVDDHNIPHEEVESVALDLEQQIQAQIEADQASQAQPSQAGSSNQVSQTSPQFLDESDQFSSQSGQPVQQQTQSGQPIQQESHPSQPAQQVNQPDEDQQQSQLNQSQQQDQVDEDQQPQVQPQQPQQQAQPQQAPQHNFSGLLAVLVDNNAINLDLAHDINNAHLSRGVPVEKLVKDLQTVSEVQLTQAKAELNNIPFINVNDTGVSPEALNRIDESVAKRYQALPFAIDEQEKTLSIAMADPLNVPAISFMEQKTGFRLQTYYGVPSQIKRLITERYAQDLSGDVTAAVEETNVLDARREAALTQAENGGFIRAAPINKIVSTVLEYAMQSRASDVHIEPLPEKTRVRYRIDGILHERLILPKSVHDAVVSRIKILSDLKIDEKRVPQDGRFDYKTAEGLEIDLRVSSCPGVHGEKIVMRLLKKNQAVPELEELGMSGLALQRVRQAIRMPHGIFLVTGPTGSGKTTSLYSILHIINNTEVNIITLEDPVEYQMKGVNQVQINPQAGLTFANGLRSFLRQDPDIIMVGEIRDTETAGLAVQASLTGHLVFSTLHTNSAAGALPRLIDMNVEPFLLSSSMILTMGQRVVRRINSEYKEEYKPEPAVINNFKEVLGKHFDDWCQKNNKTPEEITLFRPKSDRPQNEPDYKGRIGIFEVMDISEKIISLINQEASTDEIEEQARKEGMILMKQDGYLKVLDGITTVEEVLRVAEVAN